MFNFLSNCQIVYLGNCAVYNLTNIVQEFQFLHIITFLIFCFFFFLNYSHSSGYSFDLCFPNN